MSVYNKYTVYIILLVTIILIFTGCKNDDNREIVNTKLTCLNSIEIGLEADVLFINDEYVSCKESMSENDEIFRIYYGKELVGVHYKKSL